MTCINPPGTTLKARGVGYRVAALRTKATRVWSYVSASVHRQATCGCWRCRSNIFLYSNLERFGGLVEYTHTWSAFCVFLYLDKRKWKIWLYGWLAGYQKSWKGWCSIKEFTFSKAGSTARVPTTDLCTFIYEPWFRMQAANDGGCSVFALL